MYSVVVILNSVFARRCSSHSIFLFIFSAPFGQLYVNDVKINICKNCLCYIDFIAYHCFLSPYV